MRENHIPCPSYRDKLLEFVSVTSTQLMLKQRKIQTGINYKPRYKNYILSLINSQTQKEESTPCDTISR